MSGNQLGDKGICDKVNFLYWGALRRDQMHLGRLGNVLATPSIEEETHTLECNSKEPFWAEVQFYHLQTKNQISFGNLLYLYLQEETHTMEEQIK